MCDGAIPAQDVFHGKVFQTKFKQDAMRFLNRESVT
jgi:hypothetical protein